MLAETVGITLEASKVPVGIELANFTGPAQGAGGRLIPEYVFSCQTVHPVFWHTRTCSSVCNGQHARGFCVDLKEINMLSSLTTLLIQCKQDV